jgi:hypothetical protein
VVVIALHPDMPDRSLLGDLSHAKACTVIGSANDPEADRSSEHRFTVFGNIRFVLDLLDRSQLSFAGLLTRVHPIHDAARAYGNLEGGEPFVGLGLQWDW